MNKQEIKVANILACGEASVRDLTINFVGSPTKTISDLRKKGVNIVDRWVKTSEGARYKVYKIAEERA